MRKIERLGERNTNYQGQEMTIIRYKNRRDIDVEFGDGYIVRNTNYRAFCNGAIPDHLFPSYLGVGYLGDGKYKSRINNKKTSSYRYWGSMLTRCYSDKYIKKGNYKDCYVSDEWLNFQNFAEWHNENFYKIHGERLELDKDIIQKGNKVYCPSKCLYVPHKINTIICNRHNDRGKYKIGVTYDSNSNLFLANCNINGKSTFLGTYKTENDAFMAYKIAKEKEIKRVSDMYIGKIPDRVISAIQQYKIEEKD